MSSGQEERVDTSVPSPGEETVKWRPPPRRGDAGYRKRSAVIGIAAVPSVVLALLLLCGISAPRMIRILFGDVFSGEPISLWFIIIVPAALEGVVLVPGLYSLVRSSRRAGGVTLVMGAVAALLYVAYAGLFWLFILIAAGIGSHGAAIAH